jgi:hypothetical protein
VLRWNATTLKAIGNEDINIEGSSYVWGRLDKQT